MDLLSEALRLVRIDAAAVARLSLAAPFHWRVDFPLVWSITAVRGRCACRDAAGRVHELAPGDSVLGLRSPQWSLATAFSQPARDLGAVWEAQGLPSFGGSRHFGSALHLRAPEGREPDEPGEPVELLGLAFGLGTGRPPPLFDALPPTVHVAGEDFGDPGLFDAALALVAQQAAAPRPGYAAMAARLAETVFLGLLRAALSVARPGQPAAWRAMLEPRLASALRHVHLDPVRPWSVADMARAAGLSRSSFAELFTEVLGRTPAQYLTGLRMQLACQRLAAERVPIASLAEQCGYASERAFRAAFRRHCGTSPRAWQSAARA